MYIHVTLFILKLYYSNIIIYSCDTNVLDICKITTEIASMHNLRQFPTGKQG